MAYAALFVDIVAIFAATLPWEASARSRSPEFEKSCLAKA
jgi:hypothetical protein